MSERAIAWLGGLISALSIVISVVVAIFTTMAVQVGITLGLVTALLTLGFTAFVVLREELRGLERRRLGALQLQNLLKMPELESTVVRIVDLAAQVHREHSTFMQGLVVQTIEETATTLADIADGRVVFDQSEEYRLVHKALQLTQGRVRAVAARGTRFWDTREAGVYWRLYEQAAKRLDITRVFLVASTEDEAALQRVLERHRRAGMHTYVLSRDLVPSGQAAPSVIFDEGLVHSSALPRPGDDKDRIAFTDRPADVLEAEVSFNAILQLAKEEAGEDLLPQGV